MGSSRSRSAVDSRTGPPILKSFLIHLASERGLAENSLHAYRRDLENVEAHLRERSRTLLTATADDLRSYLQNQSRAGRSTKTVARRYAALRVFLKFLAAEGHDVSSRLQQIERPKP